ncbi:MAG TPA: RDD family protein [Candidatus Brocadiales bacterium]|nr:RDD family protein [Candidatus Woesearchaeota archaeon]HLG30040.1 RDD family protein [Candidatus Brocadiales bacterium]
MVDVKNPHYGGFWIRFLAAILDVIIIGVPAFILQVGLVFATGVSSLVYVIELGAIVLTVYLDGIKGGTPGKLILGLRIVNDKGNYIGIPMAILRYIGKILSAVILGIGYIMIAFTEKKQGLHDKIAKTYVIYVR